MGFTQSGQPVEEGLRMVNEAFDFGTEVQLEVYQYLVVARTATVYLFACVADPLRKQQLYLRMHIFHAMVYGACTGGYLRIQIPQPCLNGGEVRDRKSTRLYSSH